MSYWSYFFYKKKTPARQLMWICSIELRIEFNSRETFTDNNSLPFAGYRLRCWAKSPELDSSVRPSIKAHFQVFREEGRMGPHWNQFIRIEEATNNKKKQNNIILTINCVTTYFFRRTWWTSNHTQSVPKTMIRWIQWDCFLDDLTKKKKKIYTQCSVSCIENLKRS